MIFRSLPSASRLAQCFLAAAGFLRSQFWCVFLGKKKSRCVSRSWPATSYLFQKHGDLHCLGFQSNGAVHETAWPARWSWSWVAVCCENILLQPGSGGYFYDESASGLWHTEPCFALKKHGQNGGNPSERDVMSTCDDSQGLFDLDWRKANVPALCRGQSHQKDYGQAGCELLELLEWNMVLGGFFHRSILENFRNSCCSPQLWTSRAVACHD